MNVPASSAPAPATCRTTTDAGLEGCGRCAVCPLN
jgi:hypothetical protein